MYINLTREECYLIDYASDRWLDYITSRFGVKRGIAICNAINEIMRGK